jgi:excisionase family DNA binding protein
VGIGTRMNTEARKQEIVRAALETIGEHGVQGATVSRIAKGAGITSAALYSHFENRQAILLAALDVVYEQVFDSFRATTSTDPVERIRQIFQNHAEKVRDQDPTSHAHLFLEFVASAPEEGLRDAIREKEFATASYLASIVEELQQQGKLAQTVDPELIAWLVAGWAWTGDVASSMGFNNIWYERVSPRLIDFILGTLTGETAAAAPAAAPGTELLESAVDGLPDGAVFTVEEAADILKLPAETVEQMVQERQLRAIRLAGATRIPRRALFACLRGMTADEFDGFLEQAGARLRNRGPGAGYSGSAALAG